MHKDRIKIWILSITFIVTVVSFSIFELVQSYETRIHAMYKEADLSGYLVSEWIEKSLLGIRAILKDALFDIGYSNVLSSFVGVEQSELRNRGLAHKTSQYDDIIFLGIFDPDCVIQYGSLGSIIGDSSKELNRHYCLEAKTPPYKLKFSDLFISSTGQLNVSATFPAISEDNQFVGFALAGLNLHFFQKWLDSIENPAITISIIDMNQILLARKPESKNIGRRIQDALLARFVQSKSKSETFRYISPVDDIERFWSLRKVEEFPFVVAVGYKIDDALDLWRIKLIVYIIGNILLIVVTFFLVLSYQKNLLSTVAMKKLAMQDALTGLMNRRSFEEIAKIQFNEAKNSGRNDITIMIDVDYFKKINDQHGHDVGDETLKGIANLIQSNFRTSDLVCRWGGEEFLVYLTNTNESDAKMLAEKLRTKISKELSKDSFVVTVSQGLASTLFHESYEQMLKTADECLYKAKSEGRNRVCCCFKNC